jgi:hypothetical protein
MEFKLYISKVQKWKYIAMHPAVFAWLSNIPEEERTGRLFPWESKEGVYGWLRPLRKRLGVHFTPHMARHRFVTHFKREKASDKQIERMGSWTDHHAISQYEDVSDADAREMIGRIGSNRKQ